MNSKVLVVGGAGYVGGAVVDRCLHLNYETTVYDNLIFEDMYRKRKNLLKFIFGDVRDYDKLKSIVNNYDCIVWLAALVGDEACNINPQYTIDVNENSVRWLVENYKESGHIIFTSTCSVYGIQKDFTKELDETSPINPISLYAVTKYNAERILDGRALIFRLGTLFGVGDDYSRVRFDLVLNRMVANAVMNKKILVYGGDQYRPLLHVKDIAHLISVNIDKYNVGIYNVVKQNVTIKNLAVQINNHFPDLDITYDKKLSDARDYKVTSLYNPLKSLRYIYTLDEGIEEIKELVGENRIKDINNFKYSNVNCMKEYLK